MTIEEFNEKYKNKYEIEYMDFGVEFTPFYMVSDIFTYVRPSYLVSYVLKHNWFNFYRAEHTPPQLLSDILLVFNGEL